MIWRIYSDGGFQWHEEKGWLTKGGNHYGTPRKALDALANAKNSKGEPLEFSCGLSIRKEPD